MLSYVVSGEHVVPMLVFAGDKQKIGMCGALLNGGSPKGGGYLADMAGNGAGGHGGACLLL